MLLIDYKYLVIEHSTPLILKRMLQHFVPVDMFGTDVSYSHQFLCHKLNQPSAVNNSNFLLQEQQVEAQDFDGMYKHQLGSNKQDKN